jgi:hypothetical protein
MIAARPPTFALARHWTPAEDAALAQQVGADPPGKGRRSKRCWTEVAAGVPGRDGKQCRERWRNHVNPAINKSRFSAAELAHVQKRHAEIGPKWARIATELSFRTDSQVKNAFNANRARGAARVVEAEAMPPAFQPSEDPTQSIENFDFFGEMLAMPPQPHFQQPVALLPPSPTTEAHFPSARLADPAATRFDFSPQTPRTPPARPAAPRVTVRQLPGGVERPACASWASTTLDYEAEGADRSLACRLAALTAKFKQPPRPRAAPARLIFNPEIVWEVH